MTDINRVEKNVTFINNIAYMNVGTHETHCCAKHGCKYFSGPCPVADKAVEQAYGREYCVSSSVLKTQIAALVKEIAWSESLEARGLTLGDGDYY